MKKTQKGTKVKKVFRSAAEILAEKRLTEKLQKQHHEDGHRVIKLKPFQALEKFRNGVATVDNWCTIAIRMDVGLVLAKQFFTEDTVKQFEEAHLMIQTLKTRYIETDVVRASPMEIDLLRMGLEATDSMQDEVSNKDLLDAYEKAVENIKINGIQ